MVNYKICNVLPNISRGKGNQEIKGLGLAHAVYDFSRKIFIMQGVTQKFWEDDVLKGLGKM